MKRLNENINGNPNKKQRIILDNKNNDNSLFIKSEKKKGAGFLNKIPDSPEVPSFRDKINTYESSFMVQSVCKDDSLHKISQPQSQKKLSIPLTTTTTTIRDDIEGKNAKITSSNDSVNPNQMRYDWSIISCPKKIDLRLVVVPTCISLLDFIPNELWAKIYNHSSISSRIALLFTCKKFYNLEIQKVEEGESAIKAIRKKEHTIAVCYKPVDTADKERTNKIHKNTCQAILLTNYQYIVYTCVCDKNLNFLIWIMEALGVSTKWANFTKWFRYCWSGIMPILLPEESKDDPKFSPHVCPDIDSPQRIDQKNGEGSSSSNHSCDQTSNSSKKCEIGELVAEPTIPYEGFIIRGEKLIKLNAKMLKRHIDHIRHDICSIITTEKEIPLYRSEPYYESNIYYTKESENITLMLSLMLQRSTFEIANWFLLSLDKFYSKGFDYFFDTEILRFLPQNTTPWVTGLFERLMTKLILTDQIVYIRRFFNNVLVQGTETCIEKDTYIEFLNPNSTLLRFRIDTATASISHEGGNDGLCRERIIASGNCERKELMYKSVGNCLKYLLQNYKIQKHPKESYLTEQELIPNLNITFDTFIRSKKYRLISNELLGTSTTNGTNTNPQERLVSKRKPSNPLNYKDYNNKKPILNQIEPPFGMHPLFMTFLTPSFSSLFEKSMEEGNIPLLQELLAYSNKYNIELKRIESHDGYENVKIELASFMEYKNAGVIKYLFSNHERIKKSISRIGCGDMLIVDMCTNIRFYLALFINSILNNDHNLFLLTFNKLLNEIEFGWNDETIQGGLPPSETGDQTPREPVEKLKNQGIFSDSLFVKNMAHSEVFLNNFLNKKTHSPEGFRTITSGIVYSVIEFLNSRHKELPENINVPTHLCDFLITTQRHGKILLENTKKIKNEMNKLDKNSQILNIFKWLQIIN